MRAAFLLVATVILLPAAAEQAQAQLIGEAPDEETTTSSLPRGYVSLGAKGAQPLEDFADYIDFGYGFGGSVSHALDPQRVFSIRANVDYLIYGHESSRFYAYGYEYETTRSNNILSVGVGPHIASPAGAVRPYINGTVGFSYFSTSTSISSPYYDEDVDSWTDFSDGVMAWTAGGGVLIPLTSSARPVLLNIGATYHGNGEAEYLREGSIEEDPETGRLYFTPIRSQTNLVVYTLGVSFGAW